MTGTTPPADLDARRGLYERFRPFVEEPASEDLSVYWGDNSEWPEGAQLREIFDEELYGGLRLIEHVRFFDLDQQDAHRRLVQHLAENLIFGYTLPADRVAQASELATELLAHFGPGARWRITYAERHPDVSPHFRFFSSLCAAQRAGLIIGRNDNEVLVLFVTDSEPEDDY